ncbi:MAG: PD-(D/E)XK nuclease family protein, partial [Clostridia bacterium]|nr:PD-(D/E)XK nuclease family protein [Clostridia bacterium]
AISVTNFFIDNFINFSPAEYSVISALLKNAKTVTVSLMLDDFSKKEAGDLFFPTYLTYQNLRKLAEKESTPLSAVKLEESNDSFYTELFDGIPKNAPQTTYSMTNAKNPQEEIRYIVDVILKKVAEGARYRDCTVLTGDLEQYRDSIEKEFQEAGIPCFLDAKSPLTENPVSRIFLNLFAMLLSDYRKDAVLEYLKCICAVYPVHREVCIFEEMLLRFHMERWDLSQQERFSKKCEFIRSQKNYFSQNMDDVQFVYDSFLLPVIENFNGKQTYFAAFQNYAKAIQLEETVKTFLEEKEAALRKETVTAYNTILTAIKNIDVLIRGDELPLADYYSILKQSLELYQSGEIPNTLDAVTVSDIERGRSLSSPYVFIPGMNEGVTPKANNNTTYLSDLERETILELTGIELPTSLNQNCASNLSLYRAFLTAEKHLYLSKNEAESEESRQMPCYLWSRMEQFSKVEQFTETIVNRPEYTRAAVITFQNPYKQRLQPKIAPDFLTKDERKEQLRSVWSQLEQMKAEKYFEPEKKLSRKLMETQYQKRLNTSVSRLETYQKCGYAYFINYILKISEREDVSYDFRKTGTLIHNLFEQFSKCMKKDGLNWETVEETYIETQIEALVPKEIMRSFPDLSLFNPRTKYLTKKIKRLLR